MNRLALVVLILIAVVVGWLMFRGDDGNPIPPRPLPTPSVRPTPPPEPFPDPEPEPDDDAPLAKIPVCCCSTPYGACVDVRMVRQAARLHALQHDHDLIGRGCASADEEDHALWRMLRRPEEIEVFSRSALVMADRAAYRERVKEPS